MAFFDELRQRKVVRVAVAYLVVAWLGVQVASIALPAFDAPAWVLRVLILVLALGFPLALVLAWAVDLTPAGPRFAPGGAGWKRMLAISAAIGLLAIGWFVFGQPAWRTGDAPPASATVAAPAAAARSIAVLPFVNMSGDPANEYFSDGLAETTLDMLAQVHDLKVIARTSSFAFKGKSRDVREIGRALDAAHLLEGSVQQSGKMVRITAQLVRTSDGAHLWSHRYDRQLTDVFKIQDEIAGEVVKALQLALAPAERQRLAGRRTTDVSAYQSYLRGIALLPKRRVPDMRIALGHFEDAIARDPDYAPAHAAAAFTLSLLHGYGNDLTAGEQRRRREHIARALALDPGLGEAYLARGAMREQAADIFGAAEDYRHATELSPNYATGFQWYGELLRNRLGEPARALPFMERAVKLDPLSPVIRNEYSMTLASLGQFDRALALNAELIAAHPDYAGAYQSRARLYEITGNLPGALRAWDGLRRADPDAYALQGGRCGTLLRFGLIAETAACADDIEARSGSKQITMLLRVGLLQLEGKHDQAVALLGQVQSVDPWDRAWTLAYAGRAAEALPILQSLDPGMFLQPTPKLVSNYASDAVLAGLALLSAGAQAQGRDLLQRALADNARHPLVQLQFGRGYNDVVAWSLLGDHARACASMREAAAAGLVIDDLLPAAPFMREAVAQPCFQQALAAARARRAAQVAAARKAGLL